MNIVCQYQSGIAGYISTQEIRKVKATYDFTPDKSGTHFSLISAFEKDQHALITLKHDNNYIQMNVLEMDSRSITLDPVFAIVTCPSCKKTLRIKNEHPGSSVQCKYCNKYHPTVRENGYILSLASGLKSVEYAHGERQENMQCLLEHVEHMIPLEKWGFKQSIKMFVDNERYPSIIYNSIKCRVKFSLDYSGSGRSYAAFITYGRLHAPDDKSIMKWNNDDYICWHRIEESTISFLEGSTPNEANKRQINLWQEILNSSEFINSGTAQIQNPLRVHTIIWEKYGDTLFNLFDLNNSELWAKYAQFLKDYHEIRRQGKQYSNNFPEPYKIY